MNEKLQYATMLEMPFSTANVTVMPTKKKKRKTKTVNPEAVKEQLIEKVNSEELEQNTVQDIKEERSLVDDLQTEEYEMQTQSEINTASVKRLEKPSRAKKFKISVIAVQFVVIGALIATILLTNAINPNSGINAFFKGAFSSTPSEVVDERLHQEFAPVIALNESDYVMENGVITLSKAGSIYSPCDGVITSVLATENGKYSVEIEYSKNFKSLLTGLDFVYGVEGGTVYSNIPVGYMSATGATMCFTGADGSVISGYQIVDNSVVWAV